MQAETVFSLFAGFKVVKKNAKKLPLSPKLKRMDSPSRERVEISAYSPLFLWGLPGSGKSFRAKQLAEHWSLSFVDLDEYLEDKLGCSIPDFFRQEGELAFRDLESQALREVLALRRYAIISTGGGTPCFGDHAEWMQRHGLTIWMDTPLETIAQRLKAEDLTQRPLFRDCQDEADVLACLQNLYAQRRAFYAQARCRWVD